jgi:hypothetical protein
MTSRINTSRESERLLALNELGRKIQKIDKNKESSNASQVNRKINGSITKRLV